MTPDRGFPHLSLLVGVAVAAVYLSLLPTVVRTWRATGDEPHYLLAAHSLVNDLDLDLTNNYTNLDYLNFYFSKEITPQVRQDRAGRWILDHQPGLPVLMAPAYALGGRAGVLAFFCLLGGALAAFTFRLTAHICGDDYLALFSTALVSFSPPLLMYHYLVYPELPAALLMVFIVYTGLARRRPSLLTTAAILLALAALPWLNRRFIPLSFLLALYVIFTLSRFSSSSRAIIPHFRLSRALSLRLLLPLVVSLLSTLALLWFNSQLQAPPRADITTPVDASMFWTRLARSVGWLVDQQRGLLIFAPLYLLVLWGLPPLFQRREEPQLWILPLPFLLSLGVAALAGGFWTAWELGPRPLVAALPLLAPLLALAWQAYGRFRLWQVALLLLALVSLAHSAIIFRRPELPYKSSLPLFYADRLSLPLPDFLPAMAGYTRLSAPPGGWRVLAGQPLPVVQSGPLTRLPFGYYRFSWPVQVEPDLPGDTPVLRLSVKWLGGGTVFQQIVTAGNLSTGRVTAAFFNPNADHWRTPMVFHAVSTGKAGLRAGDVLFTPDPLYGWLLPYLSLGLVGLVFAVTARRPVAPRQWRTIHLSKGQGWSLLTAVILVTAGWLAYRLTQTEVRYPAVALFHLTGEPARDPQAGGRRVWRVDPQQHAPQKAVYGPFDIYDQGRYHIVVRARLIDPAPANDVVAVLRVVGAADPAPLVSQSLEGRHFRRAGQYHEFVLPVTNSRRQALSIEVNYTATAALMIDEVAVRKDEEGDFVQ